MSEPAAADYTAPDYYAQMGFSHLELTRSLASAVAPYRVSKAQAASRGERGFTITLDTRTAHLTIGEEKIRRIASLELPVVDVRIRFEHFSQTERHEFLDKFKKYLHRGGG